MSMGAIERRLKALEHRSVKNVVPPTAFVLWERSADDLQAALRRAVAAGAVKPGDPIIMGVIDSGPLPESRWTDLFNLSAHELAHLAVSGGDNTEASLDDRSVRSMSDADLNAAIVARLPRVAA